MGGDGLVDEPVAGRGVHEPRRVGRDEVADDVVALVPDQALVGGGVLEVLGHPRRDDLDDGAGGEEPGGAACRDGPSPDDERPAAGEVERDRVARVHQMPSPALRSGDSAIPAARVEPSASSMSRKAPVRRSSR